MSPQPTSQIPASSRLLPLPGRLLHRIPSWRGLRPFLLRPPPAASGFYPLASPPTPLVPRLPPFALRPLAFVASLSRHSRPRRRPGRRPPAWRLALATPGPTRISSSCPRSPQTTPKSAPPQPKSFLEKTLTARESATSAACPDPVPPPAPSPPREGTPAGRQLTCGHAALPPSPLRERGGVRVAATPSNQPKPAVARRPVAPLRAPPWQAANRPRPHSQTSPKSAPPQPKSFLEKTLNAREAAAIRAPGHPTAPPAPRHACLAGLPFACCSARMPAYVPG